MSKSTFFKRVALTAIAALGLGVFSVLPAQATVSGLTVTVVNGTSTVTSQYVSDSTTAATITVAGLFDSANDSVTVDFVQKSVPAGAAAVARLYYFDSTTPLASSTLVDSPTMTADGVGASAISGPGTTGGGSTAYLSGSDSLTGLTIASNKVFRIQSDGGGDYVGAKFALQLESETARIKGTYTYTVIVKTYAPGATGLNGLVGTQTADVSIVIPDTAANQALAAGTIDPSKTTAILNAGSSVNQISDSDTSVLATASNTTRATIRVRTYTSTSLQAPESVTVTITGPGLVGTSAGVFGKSITTAADGDDTFLIRSDGTAGTASIVVKTTTVTFPAKQISFYAAAPSTITVSTYRPVVGVGSATLDVVRATIKDADGITWGGAAYIYSADPTIASSATPALCTFSSTLGVHQCPVQGKLKGTASLKVINASTVAAATVTSDATTVRVSTGVATTATISFDKATYAPGEKAQLRVSILDQEGLSMPQGTITAAFAAALVSNVAFGAGSDPITGTTNIVLDGATSATSNTNAGHDTFIVYMPMQAGTVTVTGVGSIGLAPAGRVAVTGSAAVEAPVDPAVAAAQASADAASDAALEAIDAANAATDAANLAAEAADAATVAAEEARDAADAATAAVEALATEVATLMAALKAQITTLAKTVAKIAKKVKA